MAARIITATIAAAGTTFTATSTTVRAGSKLGVRSARAALGAGLSGFLTTDANAIVAPIHPKAMPVILTTPAEVELWLAAEAAEAIEVQRPLPDDALRIVAKGEKEDRSPEFAT